MTLLPLTSSDLQATAPATRLGLDAAGVEGIVRGLLLPGHIACTALIDISVGVPPAQRGVHMSRFHEAIEAAVLAAGMDPGRPGTKNEARGSGAGIPAGAGLELLAEAVAREAAARQQTPGASAVVRATIVVPAASPASGLPSLEPISLVAGALVAEGVVRRTLEVSVTGMTACPCAQELVREGARERLAGEGYTPGEVARILELVPAATHNQRGTATLALETSRLLDPAVLAELAWNSMSARTYELLKRADERAVVEAAHANPRFVEDCVRELVRSVLSAPLGLADDDRVAAAQVNHESIHAHDVRASLAGSVGELRARLS